MEQCDPPQSLIDWCDKYPLVSGIVLPQDRCWFYYSGELRRTPEGWWGLCSQLMKMKRAITKDPKQVLYIGFCGCHERIWWCYREK